ncbi:hypothetical protein Tco_1167156 [Tanacetum coccineum]
MSGTIPPIPPPFDASSGNPGSPNVNRVDTMPTTSKPINNTTTTNVVQNVADENLPQLLDLRGGSHVINSYTSLKLLIGGNPQEGTWWHCKKHTGKRKFALKGLKKKHNGSDTRNATLAIRVLTKVIQLLKIEIQ